MLNKPGKAMIKRIIALPGETVQIEDGYVYINGMADHDFDFDMIDSPGIAKDPVILGQNEYFVLGDNRNSSEDSRSANIGIVKSGMIVGKAWFKLKFEDYRGGPILNHY